MCAGGREPLSHQPTNQPTTEPTNQLPGPGHWHEAVRCEGGAREGPQRDQDVLSAVQVWLCVCVCVCVCVLTMSCTSCAFSCSFQVCHAHGLRACRVAQSHTQTCTCYWCCVSFTPPPPKHTHTHTHTHTTHPHPHTRCRGVRGMPRTRGCTLQPHDVRRQSVGAVRGRGAWEVLARGE